MSHDIYKLTDSKGETRYEMMSGERAQRKNYRREENKLANRWLPVELEDLPNDAEIYRMDGKTVNAGELKGEDRDEEYLTPSDRADQATELDSQPVKPILPTFIAVDSAVSNPTEAVQPLPAVQTSASVVPSATGGPSLSLALGDRGHFPETPLPEGGWGGRNPAASPKPDWFKGEPALMDDDDLLAVWMEYETDPRRDSAYSNAEFDYRRDIRDEYAERAKEQDRQKQAIEAKETLADPQVRELLTEQAEQGNGLAKEMLAVETQPAPQISHDDYYGVNQSESVQTYQLVGTTRIVQMTASEAKLLNANMDGEWIYTPELKQFAKPRKDENGEGKRRQKWRGISGTNLLMLCGSEGLGRNIAREVVRRLTGLEAADSTANVKMSEGRRADADLPELNREAWSEFYHTVGEVKKTIRENGGNRIVTVPETDPTGSINVRPKKRLFFPQDNPPETTADEREVIAAVKALDDDLTEGDKEIGKRVVAVEKLLSEYRLRFQSLIVDMEMDLQKALTD